MRRPIPCARCGKAILRAEDLTTRIVHQNFAYFCGSACAGKLKLREDVLAATGGSMAPAQRVQAAEPTAEQSIDTPDAPQLSVAATANLHNAASAPARASDERNRILLACAFASLGMFARSAPWHQWLSAALLVGGLLLCMPLSRFSLRTGSVLRPRQFGAYTAALGLWAYVAGIFSASWWVCGLSSLPFAYVAFAMRDAPSIPPFFTLLAHGEWQRDGEPLPPTGDGPTEPPPQQPRGA